jgi:hypothetical protein
LRQIPRRIRSITDTSVRDYRAAFSTPQRACIECRSNDVDDGPPATPDPGLLAGSAVPGDPHELVAVGHGRLPRRREDTTVATGESAQDVDGWVARLGVRVVAQHSEHVGHDVTDVDGTEPAALTRQSVQGDKGELGAPNPQAQTGTRRSTRRWRSVPAPPKASRRTLALPCSASRTPGQHTVQNQSTRLEADGVGQAAS